MIDRVIIFASALLLSGCTNFQQYVYNCTPTAIRFSTGYRVAPQSYFGLRTGLRPFTEKDYALLSNGTYQAPLRVNQERVTGSDHGDSWAEPANVCGQFTSQVVIVDLR